MNIVFIVSMYLYLKGVDKYYNSLITYCQEHSIHNITILWGAINKNVDINKTYNPDLIIFFDIDTVTLGDKFNKVFKLNIPICSSATDYCRFNDCINDTYFKLCDAMMFLYKSVKLQDSYKNVFPEKIITNINSRYVDTRKFKNHNLKKKYDILIYGNRDVSYYPLRARIENLLIKNKDKYNLMIIKSSGGLKCKPEFSNENLSKLLNQSYLCMATSSYADIMMHKYLEISASYSTILGNYPSDYKDLFKNNIIEVDLNMTDDKILNIIDNALSNKTKLSVMAKRLGDIVHKEHNLDCAVKDFDDKFEYIVSEYKQKH